MFDTAFRNLFELSLLVLLTIMFCCLTLSIKGKRLFKKQQPQLTALADSVSNIRML